VSAPVCREEAPDVTDGRITFTIVIEAQEITVDYRARWMTGYGHFEFRSPHEPPRPIPVSETGYRSYFAAMEDVELWASPQDFAHEVALRLLQSRRTGNHEDHEEERNQLSLF
jgi:hypothetical protein